jgi:hypothetical protein
LNKVDNIEDFVKLISKKDWSELKVSERHILKKVGFKKDINTMYSFLISDLLPETRLLSFFKECFNLVLESFNYPNSGADIYLQYTEYDGEIKLSINILWKNSLNNNTSEKNIAQNIAKFFNTKVLIELPESEIYEGREYIMYDENGERFVINLEEREEGIFLDKKSKLPRK